VAELYKGAFKSPARDRWLTRIEEGILAGITVLPFDTGTARHCGAIRVDLEIEGRMPGEADLQIAATALQHGLVVVTGNVRHYAGVPGLAVSPVLVETRA